jgi:hypothetical protein
MSAWKLGERVEHPTFGVGTVLQCDEQHTTVHFDDHGRRKFASHMVVLNPIARPTEDRSTKLRSDD